MSRDLRPSEGARYLLERTSGDMVGARATYRGVIFLPEGEHAYAVELIDDGSATLVADGAAATAELEEGLGNLARSMARAATRRRTEGLLPWPDRMLRWRGPGRG